MTLFVLAYAAGLLTIATPCILPIVPFVLVRAGQPFRRGSLPLLIGLALTFAAVASLASVAGGWAVDVNRYGRSVALAAMALFGLAMLFPALAVWMMAPFVSLGSWLSGRAGQHLKEKEGAAGSSILLGVAAGLLWAPCAGPVLGLILTGAALRGPSIETALLLLTYGLGAATSLGAAMLFGRRVLAFTRQSARWDDWFRRVLGAAIVTGAVTIWLGADTGLLTRLSSASTNSLEQGLIAALRGAPVSATARADAAATSGVTLPAPLKSLFEAGPWLNTQLRPDEVRGKVVLVNFWTYSCINCLRTLPYLRAWAQKYKDRGLVVVGVHTPEFAFEKDVANVRKALASLGVGYPVVIDNDFTVWRAFNNQAWPAIYFVGADGRIRDHAIGEGNYDQSERLIQELLSETTTGTAAKDLTGIRGEGAQAAPDVRNLRSAETYVGYRHASNFASPGGIKRDTPSRYRAASVLSLNRWSVEGDWTIGGEFATLNEARGRVAYRFHARDLHLVLAPAAQGQSVRFRVTIDGAPPGADHGVDVDAEGYGRVEEERLYQLARQAGPVKEHTFEIEFLDPGVRAYAFTFG
ncbi:cytochrome c biogenesis protein CcdA [Bradyrhizobium sp. LHD-71]|uniref:redoxin domain-containing protein n=1 Tax=Bradyrhizobium sp. LHD-71 TaxID=3072141 RepID=UPI00280E3B88|nr:cytochrome c biogenesis protein CcdA [Bradyrhizobium sp. LHD-71]MDQ8732584.1 cytochrome c biogenesis protein CcdA [Bradyrhizobium sp. LHD-71]